MLQNFRAWFPSSLSVLMSLLLFVVFIWPDLVR